jgi:hypothetical protein
MDTENIRMTIRLTKDIYEILDSISKTKGESKNTVIRQACWEMINKWEENKQANK